MESKNCVLHWKGTLIYQTLLKACVSRIVGDTGRGQRRCSSTARGCGPPRRTASEFQGSASLGLKPQLLSLHRPYDSTTCWGHCPGHFDMPFLICPQPYKAEINTSLQMMNLKL